MEEENPFLKEITSTILFQIHRIDQLIQMKSSILIKKWALPIDIDQLPVLMCVYFCDSISQQEIANNCNRDKSSVKRTLEVFRKKGLVVIEAHPVDKRKTIVKTTEAGSYITERIREMIKVSEKEMFSFLTSKEKEEMYDRLRKIIERIEVDDEAKL